MSDDEFFGGPRDGDSRRSPDASSAATANADGDGLPIGTILKLLVAAAIIAAIVIFVLQNLDNVPVDFLSFSFDAPLILLLAVAAVAGVLVRWIFSFWRSRR